MSSENASQSLSIAENRDLIEEVRFATEQSPQSDLYRFTTLLLQIMDTVGNDPSQWTAQADAFELIQEAVREIRSVAEADQTTSPGLETLLDHATHRWSEKIEIAAALSENGTFDDAADWDADSCLANPIDVTDEDSLQAPTADEIALMLRAIGESPSPADPSAK
ncbi:MAG: hypothetical protein HKN47_17550, partial [Pirellulaceae bacterium]|nr:hypothetical protein [Pirellulaceae bacterium]